MKNKTWIWICAAVVLILAVLLIWKPFGAKDAQPAEEPAVSQEPVEQAEAPAPSEESQPQEEEEEQETSGGILIEGDGVIEIVVPEGEASGGF